MGVSLRLGPIPWAVIADSMTALPIMSDASVSFSRMIADVGTLGEGTTIDADVCVVGAGPAGLAMLPRLREHGISVIVLESGGLGWDPTLYYMNEGESVGQQGDDLKDSRRRGLGGTATAWKVEIAPEVIGARYRPLDPVDFEPKDWIPNSGWPIRGEELAPHYERAQELCGLGRFKYASADWARVCEGPMFTSERLEPVVFQGGSKESFTELPLAVYQNGPEIRIFLRATAYEFEIERDGSMRSIRATDPYGGSVTARARVFVLAAGGIENARLLLKLRSDGNSASGIRSDALGNTFMEHIHTTTAAFIPADPTLFEAMHAHSWHNCAGTPIQWKYRLSEHVARVERTAQYCVYLRDQLRSSYCRTI